MVIIKPDEIRNLYTVTSRVHEAVVRTLHTLDSVSPDRYRRKAVIRRFAVVLAAAVLLAAFSSAAYATNLFGLLTHRVGAYGMDLHVVTDPKTDSALKGKPAKLMPAYLPKGCCQLICDDDEFHPILNYDGETIYNPNGNYTYTDGNGVWVHFHVYDADVYHEEARYIVDSFEREYSGHKTVFLTRRFEDNGDEDRYAVKYFEDWGYVVDCYYGDLSELMKIMEGLGLQEADDYVEPETTDMDTSDDPYAGYAFSMEEEERICGIGETFLWSGQIVDAPSPDYCFKDGEYAITVRSFEEHDGVKGLDRSHLLAPDDVEWYSRYFNPDGSLKTPYIRTDRNLGDGINSLGHSESKQVERRFYLVTVEVQAIEESYGGFNGQLLSKAGGVIYLDKRHENKTDIFTVGVVADEDDLSDLALDIPSVKTVIDSESQTVVHKDICTVIPLPVHQ